MNSAETILKAIKKMPNAKELWGHPNDLTDDGFLNSLGLTVKKCSLMEEGMFLLFNPPLEQELKEFNLSFTGQSNLLDDQR